MALKLAIFALAATAIFSGCTANYKLDSSKTENGFLASRNEIVGTVYLWPRGTSKLQKAGVIEIADFRHRAQNGRNSTISFSSDAEYAGGGQLTGQQKLNAGVAIREKSTLKTTNEILVGYSAPRNALIEAVRGDPNFWYIALEIEAGVPKNAPRVVFIHEIVAGEKLELDVEGVTDASAEFPLEGVAGANAKFKIINAGNLEIESSKAESRVPLYSRVAVFDMVQTSNGPAFPRAQENILAELANVLASGN
jgi:hypothetical protein